MRSSKTKSSFFQTPRFFWFSFFSILAAGALFASAAFGWTNPSQSPSAGVSGVLSVGLVSPFQGNAGIGTIAPANKLTVYGKASIGAAYKNQTVPAAFGEGLIVKGKAGFGEAALIHIRAPLTIKNGGIALGRALVVGREQGSVPRGNVTHLISSVAGRYLSMIIGSDGLPVISYYEDPDFKFLKCITSDCTSRLITKIDTAALTGIDNSMTIGPDGFPVIAYNAAVGAKTSIKVAKCLNASCANFTVTGALELDSINPSVRIGSDNGMPIIAYFNTETGDLKVVKCGSPDCSQSNSPVVIEDTDASSLESGVISLAIGYDSFPMMSYSYPPGVGTLKFARCSQYDCGASAITAMGSGGYNSLTIGPDGLPVIAVYVKDGQAMDIDELRVIKCGNSSCNFNNSVNAVDAGKDLGSWNSITIGADGQPIISYLDIPNNQIKAVKCGDAKCDPKKNTVMVVKQISPGIVRFGTAIAIGADGLPIISYHDSQSLQLTRCGSERCIPNWIRK